MDPQFEWGLTSTCGGMGVGTPRLSAKFSHCLLRRRLLPGAHLLTNRLWWLWAAGQRGLFATETLWPTKPFEKNVPSLALWRKMYRPCLRASLCSLCEWCFRVPNGLERRDFSTSRPPRNGCGRRGSPSLPAAQHPPSHAPVRAGRGLCVRCPRPRVPRAGALLLRQEPVSGSGAQRVCLLHRQEEKRHKTTLSLKTH